jgi:hypothetical protein
VGVVLVAAAGVALAVACRAPTQASLLVTTTAQCKEIGSVAITVKDHPKNAETAVGAHFVSAVAPGCAPAGAGGDFGTLVLAPGADTGAVVVVAGYGGTRAESCSPPAYKGCIVARRAFSFVEHVTITIPVSLDPDCVDKPCDAFTTCRRGSCVDSHVDCTNSGDCNGASLPAPGSDGGPPADGTSPADGGVDGAASDGGSDADDSGGSSDADAAPPIDGGGGGGTCTTHAPFPCHAFGGNTVATCNEGQQCCASPPGQTACQMVGTSCGYQVVCCTDQSDCTGPGEICCQRGDAGPSGIVECSVAPCTGVIYCDRGNCPAGKTCTAFAGSNAYRTCQ